MQSVSVSNLLKGESCTYRIKASCGAPGFGVDDKSTAAPNKWKITYVAFNEEHIGTNSVSDLNTPLASRSTMSPGMGMPQRDSVFNKVTPIAADSIGYEGDYDIFYKGWQMFGNSEQGVTHGISSSGSADCMKRDMIVTVTAQNVDQGSDTLSLSFTAGSIQNSSVGIKLVSTVAALGLAALSVF